MLLKYHHFSLQSNQAVELWLASSAVYCRQTEHTKTFSSCYVGAKFPVRDTLFVARDHPSRNEQQGVRSDFVSMIVELGANQGLTLIQIT